jgi:hypothetical protein
MGERYSGFERILESRGIRNVNFPGLDKYGDSTLSWKVIIKSWNSVAGYGICQVSKLSYNIEHAICNEQ